jgi:hypothetical protein
MFKTGAYTMVLRTNGATMAEFGGGCGGALAKYTK